MDRIIQVSDIVKAAKEAQKIFETYTQEQVDVVVKAVGKVIYDNAETLAIEAVEESKLGNVASKIAKQRGAAMSHWMFMKGKKSMGIIEEDLINNVITYAKPIGVIACIMPSTNPTSTLCGNTMSALKSRNALICAPHPGAKKVTAHGANLIREAIQKLGAPVNLVQVIEEPSIELTNELMRQTDTTIATGGPSMVKAAYSSGKPSFGVGPGNVQVIIDKGYNGDLNKLASDTIFNRNRDYGVPCVCEQCIHVHKEDVDRILNAFKGNGAYIIKDAENTDKLRYLLFKQNKDGEYGLDASMVGKTATFLSEQMGLKVPVETKILIAMVNDTAETELLCKEKLDPVMACLPYDTFDEAVHRAVTNLNIMGAGHTSVVYSEDEKHINKVAETIPVSRLLVNCSSSNGGGANFAIGYDPTVSLGCGFWGGNSTGENLTYKHLMQTTRVARIIPNAYTPTPEEVWTD